MNADARDAPKGPALGVHRTETFALTSLVEESTNRRSSPLRRMNSSTSRSARSRERVTRTGAAAAVVVASLGPADARGRATFARGTVRRTAPRAGRVTARPFTARVAARAVRGARTAVRAPDTTRSTGGAEPRWVDRRVVVVAAPAQVAGGANAAAVASSDAVETVAASTDRVEAGAPSRATDDDEDRKLETTMPIRKRFASKLAAST